MVKLTKKELEKLAGLNVDIGVKKKTRNSFDRLSDAVDIMKQDNSRDRILFNKDYTACILEFNNIAFLSNNDLLRIDNRYLYKFKMAWHDRVESLIKGVNLSEWEETKKGQILIEFLYKTKNAQVYDPDSISSAFKSTLDGIVNSGLIVDDKVENIPLIIPKQEKTKNENSLFIVLSKIDDIDKYYSTYFKDLIKKYS